MKKKKQIKKIVLNPALWVFLVVLGVMTVNIFKQNFEKNPFSPDRSITLGNKKIKVQISQTPKDLYEGLSGVRSLPQNSGMLFVYNKEGSCPHVMRDMKFDLDFVFLLDGKVVFLKEKVPKDFFGAVESPSGCNQVLEINSGDIEKLGIKIGDVLKI